MIRNIISSIIRINPQFIFLVSVPHYNFIIYIQIYLYVYFKFNIMGTKRNHIYIYTSTTKYIVNYRRDVWKSFSTSLITQCLLYIYIQINISNICGSFISTLINIDSFITYR